ncbi:MAG: hypothetical protein ACK48Y_17790, partial [Planctomyces sp.]
MLTILGQSARYCDGVARRSFLKIGGFAMGSAAPATLASLMKADAATPNGNARQGKAIINICLGGGPPHQDMWGDQDGSTSRNSRGIQPY